MKNYTDLEQSHKLVDILPLETADAFCTSNADVIIVEPYITVLNGEINIPACDGAVPCWSLAALLSILPFHLIVNNQRYTFNMIKGLDKNGETYAIKYAIFNTTFYFHLTDYYNNPIDACYEMILKLKEKNLL